MRAAVPATAPDVGGGRHYVHDCGCITPTTTKGSPFSVIEVPTISRCRQKAALHQSVAEHRHRAAPGMSSGVVERATGKGGASVRKYDALTRCPGVVPLRRFRSVKDARGRRRLNVYDDRLRTASSS